MADTILNEIMLNAKEIPIECQEKVLDILKGMAFTKKCLLKNTLPLNAQLNDENQIDSI
ncbi:MAG: hypothetical protein E6845_17410 [Clostridium sp.]|uniref:hypothetical protein n=1 Tax=Clostridium sp. TaxID=1506 RepID=UPI0029016699|nr:hypothetical protein [Clostridium sp.]MDU1604738.1 hypothetical protein [Clostridium sp.]